VNSGHKNSRKSFGAESALDGVLSTGEKNTLGIRGMSITNRNKGEKVGSLEGGTRKTYRMFLLGDPRHRRKILECIWFAG
jgi:hypothetical protein